MRDEDSTEMTPEEFAAGLDKKISELEEQQRAGDQSRDTQLRIMGLKVVREKFMGFVIRDEDGG